MTARLKGCAVLAVDCGAAAKAVEHDVWQAVQRVTVSARPAGWRPCKVEHAGSNSRAGEAVAASPKPVALCAGPLRSRLRPLRLNEH